MRIAVGCGGACFMGHLFVCGCVSVCRCFACGFVWWLYVEHAVVCVVCVVCVCVVVVCVCVFVCSSSGVVDV